MWKLGIAWPFRWHQLVIASTPSLLSRRTNYTCPWLKTQSWACLTCLVSLVLICEHLPYVPDLCALRYVCASSCPDARRGHRVSSIALYLFLWGRVSPWSLRQHFLGYSGSQQATVILPVSVLPQSWSHRPLPDFQIVTWVLGAKLWSSWLCNKCP